MKTVHHVAEKCVDCGLCMQQCEFLQQYGTPGELCDRFLNEENTISKECFFECNLCSLCSAACPFHLDCSGAFLEIRRNIQQDKTKSIFPLHKPIASYEKAGRAPLFSQFSLPLNCHTVFFPGCALTATRSDTTLKTYAYLQKIHPAIGIVLHCCSKPSHDLGLQKTFEEHFGRLIEKLVRKKITTLITACPSCYVTFKKHAPELNTVSVYETLAQFPPPVQKLFPKKVAIHDACTTRNFSQIHQDVRNLVNITCSSSFEMEHSGKATLCCGEGAAAAFINPQLTKRWQEKRDKERNQHPLITYCAGCAAVFGKNIPNMHLLDLLFNPEKTHAGKEQRTSSPFTYIKRLEMKLHIRNQNHQSNKKTNR